MNNSPINTVSWLVFIIIAPIFALVWRASLHLSALTFLVFSVPVTLAVGLKKIGKDERDIAGFIFGISPWILFPIISITTFVPKGESGQWIGLLIITILSASIAPLVIARSKK